MKRFVVEIQHKENRLVDIEAADRAGAVLAATAEHCGLHDQVIGLETHDHKSGWTVMGWCDACDQPIFDDEQSVSDPEEGMTVHATCADKMR